MPSINKLYILIDSYFLFGQKCQKHNGKSERPEKFSNGSDGNNPGHLNL